MPVADHLLRASAYLYCIVLRIATESMLLLRELRVNSVKITVEVTRRSEFISSIFLRVFPCDIFPFRWKRRSHFVKKKSCFNSCKHRKHRALHMVLCQIITHCASTLFLGLLISVEADTKLGNEY